MEKSHSLMELNSMIENVLSKMSLLNSSIELIADSIKENKFISNKLSLDTIEQLQRIKALNESCEQLYRNIELGDIIPEEIQQVKDEVETAIWKIEREEELGKYKSFLRIKSDDEQSAELLCQKQMELKILLENYDEEEKGKLVIYNEFVEALVETEAKKILEYIFKLTPIFGQELVAKALIERTLKISESDELDASNNLNGLHLGKERFEGKSENLKNNNLREEVVCLEQIEKESVIQEVSLFHNFLSENELLIKEQLFSFDIKKNFNEVQEEKKIGAKGFTKEIESGFRKGLNALVLKSVKKFHSILPETLALYLDVNNEDLDYSVKYLFNKGYLREYGFEPLGVFYSISPKAEKAFQSQEVRKYLKIKRTDRVENDLYCESVQAILMRLAFSRLYHCYLNAFKEEKYLNLDIQDEYFILKMTDDFSKRIKVVLGTFWATGEQWEHFASKIKEELGCYKDTLEILLVAGLNMELAKKQVNILLNKLDINSQKICCYSLAEDTYFDYLSGSNCVIEDLEGAFSEHELLRVKEETQELSTEVNENKSVLEGGEPQERACLEQLFVPIKENKEEREKEVISQLYVENQNLEHDLNEIKENVYEMIISNRLYCATTYLRSMMAESIEIKELYEKLAYAVNDPWMKCSYSSELILEHAYCTDLFSEYLFIAMAMRNFFLNHMSYDYYLKSLHVNVAEKNINSANPNLTKVMYTLFSFKEKINKGINFYADYKVKDKVELERTKIRLVNDAKSYYDSYVLGHIKEKTSHKRFLETKKRIFSQSNDFVTYLKAIVEQDYEVVELISDYLKKNFIKDEATVDFSNLDEKKVNYFIDEYWIKAGDSMHGVARRTSDLVSSLRSNLYNSIEKILKVMCEWTILVEESLNSKSDEGSELYKQRRKDLIVNMKKAKEQLEISGCKKSKEELAGEKILVLTLEELISRLDGSYQEKSYKYFYIDFLRGQNVLLNSSHLPDTWGKFEDFEELSLTNRVISHSKETLKSFEERLDVIFNEYGDDYGTADQIFKYLQDLKKDIAETNYDLKTSQEIAEKDAIFRLSEFIENLELAQSYGQIEGAKENKKEKIQKIISEWFEYAKETKNYGFFNRVLEKYKEKIREEAKVRGYSLLQELNQFKEKADEHMLKKIASIEEMISKQNYTVAEDLLSRIAIDESDEDIDVNKKDYLKEFIDNYDINYRMVSDSSRKLSAIVSSRSRNKDEKGARRLLDNWMNNGQPLGETKLNSLLDALGFSDVKSKSQTKMGKIENYLVKALDGNYDRKINYKHPIAAFGSKVSEEGFRVVCLFGKYDADRLIEEFKGITGSQSTLILLDYALPITERRKLARKIKSHLDGKVYAVLDRVLLMFLVNNYNVQFINQILMSTVMPFAYYQPYVWDSSKVMPPEMFTGRKDELEKIQSPRGVNIVYGGRQLGKSALLKMAKRNIDSQEDNTRAVLVEIKGLDYKEAAKKIAFELYDAGILEEEIETEDWRELSRAIKKRLQNTEKSHIKYLLLLLDEADVFIESCEEVNYQPFDALKDVQSIGAERFKFVIAGLHNIVRFKRDIALSNNSVLTHLTSLTVKPFNRSEAKALLVEPLTYLGFRFPEEKQSLVSLILANTNYFPGLIQLYCANLVESMRKNDYGGYAEAKTPAYDISETLIKKVLADNTFMNQIQEKFEITLKLDEDNMYYIIALLLAYLYHEGVNSASESGGFSANDIIEASKELSVKKISELDSCMVNGLLQELLELNILRQTVNEQYLFSRYSFFQMMGTRFDVENKLLEYMGD